MYQHYEINMNALKCIFQLFLYGLQAQFLYKSLSRGPEQQASQHIAGCVQKFSSNKQEV